MRHQKNHSSRGRRYVVHFSVKTDKVLKAIALHSGLSKGAVVKAILECEAKWLCYREKQRQKLLQKLKLVARQ